MKGLIQEVQWPVVKCLAGRDATLEVAQLCSDGRQFMFMFLTGTMRKDGAYHPPPTLCQGLGVSPLENL